MEDKSVSVSIYVGVKVELAPSLIVNAVPADVGESFTFVWVITAKEVLLISPFAFVTL